jgi:hypothetical protein
VPERVPVPLPWYTNVTPPGRVPLSVRLAAGEPEVVTLKVPATPTVKVVLSALVIAGDWPMVRATLPGWRPCKWRDQDDA